MQGPPILPDHPHPDTPVIDNDAMREIATFEIEDLGGGVVVFHNAVKFDQEMVLDYIDGCAEEFHKSRWTYITGEDGVEYGVNEDGFRYRLEDIPDTPVRILRPVSETTPKGVVDFFHDMEDTIYKCLIRYIDLFPLIVGCLWWKNRGHILRYGESGRLGAHCDNDTNYKVTEGVRYFPRGHMAARQTCGALVYLNDSVSDDVPVTDRTAFHGGHLEFFHIGVDYAPKKGDIIFFPTNYVASHQVSRSTDGARYAYLCFFGQGLPHAEANKHIVEPANSYDWCPAMWMNNIYDDYERYCKSEWSRFTFDSEIDTGINPVYQGRCVAQYGTTHDAEVIDA